MVVLLIWGVTPKLASALGRAADEIWWKRWAGFARIAGIWRQQDPPCQPNRHGRMTSHPSVSSRRRAQEMRKVLTEIDAPDRLDPHDLVGRAVIRTVPS